MTGKLTDEEHYYLSKYLEERNELAKLKHLFRSIPLEEISRAQRDRFIRAYERTAEAMIPVVDLLLVRAGLIQETDQPISSSWMEIVNGEDSAPD